MPRSFKSQLRRYACLAGMGLAVAALSSSPAFASGEVGAKSKSDSSGSSGGGGGGGGGSGSGGSDGAFGGGGHAADGTGTGSTEGGLFLNKEGKGPKWWEIGIGWELHRLNEQNDLEGVGSSKLFNYVYLFGHIDVTRNNVLSFRGGFTQKYIADQEETGTRLTDFVVSYTRKIMLPSEFVLRLNGSLYLPTSFGSQLAGMIVEPSVGARLTKRIGWLTVEGRVFGYLYLYKGTTAANGANPNPKGSLGGTLDAELQLPYKYINAFAIGAEGYTEYYWYYNIANGGSLSSDPNFPVPSADPTYTTQPVQQYYGGEIYIRYTFPTFLGIKSDLTVSLANGDTALGYPSVIHDGIGYIYPAFRLNSEVYGALTARY